MADVLCFGNLQFDVLCRPVTAMPRPGVLTPIDHIDCMLSGNGGNVAATLGRLGVGVALAGYRGADPIGDGFAMTLDRLGVDISLLPRHAFAPTGASVVTLTPDGERGILFTNGANALFDLDSVPDLWLQGPRVVTVGSVFVLPRFSGAAVARLFVRARANGAATVLNPAWPNQTRALESLRPALAETDYLILSLDEGRELTGHTAPEHILDAIGAIAPGLVILTMGADGCVVRDQDNRRHIAAETVTATDCTGAGDAFVAGFIAGVVHGRAPAACAALGCRVAAYAVTGPGAYPRVPALAELDRAHVLDHA